MAFITSYITSSLAVENPWPCVPLLWFCILNRWQETHWRSNPLLM